MTDATVAVSTDAACSHAGGRIDVHAHFLPAAYRAALDAAGLATLDGGMPIPSWSVASALELMDRNGVATSILSVSSPGLNFVAARDEVALARAINDAAAEIVTNGGGRFGGFATLPVGEPAAAIAELGRALDTLGLDGVIMETNHRGRYPGDPALEPLYAELNARQACVFLHPTSPACLECLSAGRPAPMIEFPFDTTRAAVDLIYSGVTTRYPGIRFILSHGGGTLPFLAQRIAGFSPMLGASAGGLTPADVLAQLARFFYDTALAATPLQIGALKQIAPVSQILFGTDWPFCPAPMVDAGVVALTAMAELSDAERTAIFRDNALRLLPRYAAV